MFVVSRRVSNFSFGLCFSNPAHTHTGGDGHNVRGCGGLLQAQGGSGSDCQHELTSNSIYQKRDEAYPLLSSHPAYSLVALVAGRNAGVLLQQFLHGQDCRVATCFLHPGLSGCSPSELDTTGSGQCCLRAAPEPCPHNCVLPCRRDVMLQRPVHAHAHTIE